MHLKRNHKNHHILYHNSNFLLTFNQQTGPVTPAPPISKWQYKSKVATFKDAMTKQQSCYI